MLFSSKKANLFIYGSLRDPSIFQSVCGYSFTLRPSHKSEGNLFGELALLPNYRRVSPDNVYFYAVKDLNSKIEGIVIYDVPMSAFKEIDRYEGSVYDREVVKVNTAKGVVDTYAYLASQKTMTRQFGDRFHVNLIHELWLRKRIAKFFQKRIRPGEKTPDADIERRALRELIGTTERDLVMSHLRSDVVSDYYLEHELDRPAPSIRHLFEDENAKSYLENYIILMVKQVLLNQFEHKIMERYRYEIDHLMPSHRYFNRCLSLLIALRMINSSTYAVDSILKRCTRLLPLNGENDLIDYVKYAISAADSAFDPRVARSGIDWVRINRQPGLTPMGAELEFSNLGFNAVNTPQDKTDNAFDNFRYFNDFSLDVLSWKVGGYIDDHSGDSDITERKGFLEFAPGRLNIRGELSKPATSDPWIMNQIIHNIIEFYPIAPHSLHLTFQLRKGQYGKQKILPIGYVKCLLALGGGPVTSSKGEMWISRMTHDEIRQDRFGEEFVFARTSKRKSHLLGDGIQEKPLRNTVKYTQQYKFIRLDKRANYEALIMALKGLQIAYNPADYLTVTQLKKDKGLKNSYEKLKDWAMHPTEIPQQTISEFLRTINDGLVNEGLHKPVHKLHYIDWSLGAIDVQLRLFNKQIRKSRYF